MQKIYRYVLLLILLLAFVFRFYLLDQIPNSISADEASFSYNALSILKTGRDEFGTKYPLYIRSFDDYKNPLLSYLLIPFIAVGGLNDWTIRLPSAIIGVLIVAVAYLLVEQLTGRKKLSLLVGFFCAISPWLIQYSRVAIDMNLGLFTGLTSVWFLLKAREKPFFYVLAGVFFGLTFYSYHASKLWMVLILPVLVILFGRLNRLAVLGAVILVLAILPYLFLLRNTNINLRPLSVSVFSNQEEINADARLSAVDQEQGLSAGNLIHNRRLTPINQIINGYLFILNPQILFASNQGAHIPPIRFFYVWQLPLIFIGLFTLFVKRKLFWLFVAWLAVGFVPGGLTMLPVFDRRIIMNSFPLLFLASLGILSLPMKTLVRPFFLLLACLSVFFFSHNYFGHGRTQVVNLWGNGMRQVVEKTSELGAGYDKVIVSIRLNQPLTFFLYYLRFPPEKYLATGGTVTGGFREERNHADKYYFTSIDGSGLSEKILYVLADESPSCFRLLDQVKDSSGEIIARLGKFDPTILGCSSNPVFKKSPDG